MISKITVGAAMAAILSLPLAGSAWALPSSNSTLGDAPGQSANVPGQSANVPGQTRPGFGRRHFSCADASKLEARIQKLTATISDRLPKLQAALQKAQQSGDTQKAQKIQARIDRLTKLQARAQTIMAKIESRCQGATAPSGSASSGADSSSGTPGADASLQST